ncbi:hypothetical protein HG530_014942 [Fusarium avenaceum]|nr:hypothetical protein HG530_014942 [Fusarium avenaceum]
MTMGMATKGILQKKRSEILAKTMAEIAAATYGGAETSWAFVVEKPIAFVKEEEAGNAKNDGNNTLEDENPSPSFKTTDTVHLSDTSCEKTGESARQRTGAVERESLLEDTKKDSSSHETTEVLYKSSASHDETPAEDRQNGIVLNTRHLQIVNHAFDLCVTDVGSVDVANQVEQRQHRHKSHIDLAEDLFALLLGVVVIEFGIFRVQAENAEATNLCDFGGVLEVSRFLVADLDVALGDGASGGHGGSVVQGESKIL